MPSLPSPNGWPSLSLNGTIGISYSCLDFLGRPPNSTGGSKPKSSTASLAGRLFLYLDALLDPSRPLVPGLDADITTAYRSASWWPTSLPKSVIFCYGWKLISYTFSTIPIGFCLWEGGASAYSGTLMYSLLPVVFRIPSGGESPSFFW